MNANEIMTRAFIAKELITIDPGKTNGGIVKYKDRYESWPIKKFDFESMVDFFKYQAEICELPLIFIERMTTFNPDMQNIGRMHRLNKLKDHYVELISSIKLSKIPFIEVMPGQWQKKIKIYQPGEEYKVRKLRYKDIAESMFPGVNVVGWNADALLLVEFARHQLKYDQRWILSKLKEFKEKNINKKLFLT